MNSRHRWVILGVGAAGAGASSALRMGLPALGAALREAYGPSPPEAGARHGALVEAVGRDVTRREREHGPTACSSPGMPGASATGASGRAVTGCIGREGRERRLTEPRLPEVSG